MDASASAPPLRPSRRPIFRSRRGNDLAGLLHGNVAIGLSYDWWVDKHNRRHAHPKQIKGRASRAPRVGA
jgi:hypothetical protein